jgi:hypothetical protein
MASIVVAGDTSGTVTLTAPAVSGTTTLTLPTTTGNVVADTATQTLTNKTLTSPTITGAVVSSMASSVLTSGTAQASTSGTSIDFTSIPSWVKRITVMFSGVSTNGASPVQVQIGAGSVTTSGYVSTCANGYAANSLAVDSSSTGFITQFASASSARNGQMVLTNISGNIWVSAHMMGDISGQGGGVGGGNITLSGVLDRVRITTVGGTNTFDAGTINILYE